MTSQIWQPVKRPPRFFDPWAPKNPPPLPAVDFGEVVKLTPATLPQWQEFLVRRLIETWPNLTPQRAETRIREFMIIDGSILVHNNEAIGLAQLWNDPIDNSPFVRQVFMFSTAKRHRAWNAMLRVYRHIEAWAINRGAVRYEMEGGSDMDRGNLVDRCGCDYYDGAHRDLRPKK